MRGSCGSYLLFLSRHGLRKKTRRRAMELDSDVQLALTGTLINQAHLRQSMRPGQNKVHKEQRSGRPFFRESNLMSMNQPIRTRFRFSGCGHSCNYFILWKSGRSTLPPQCLSLMTTFSQVLLKQVTLVEFPMLRDAFTWAVKEA